jgi:hypothetical protein
VLDGSIQIQAVPPDDRVQRQTQTAQLILQTFAVALAQLAPVAEGDRSCPAGWCGGTCAPAARRRRGCWSATAGCRPGRQYAGRTGNRRWRTGPSRPATARLRHHQ